MTYQGFAIEQALVSIAPPAAADQGSLLGKREWNAVEIGRRDGPRAGDPRSLRGRVARLFGLKTARPLANERLEALRRFAIRAWYAQELRAGDIRALFDVGFSSNDVWRVLAHVGERRGFIPEVEAWPA
jgi:hypothetical protein